MAKSFLLVTGIESSVETRTEHKTWKMCKEERTWTNAPLNMAQEQSQCPQWLPSSPARKNRSFSWALEMCAMHDYMLCSVFNDLVHIMPFPPSQLVSSLRTEIMPPSPVICSLPNEHLQKSCPWLCSKCQWSHPWTQNPSGLSKSMRALRCNLRSTSRINKSLP